MFGVNSKPIKTRLTALLMLTLLIPMTGAGAGDVAYSLPDVQTVAPSIDNGDICMADSYGHTAVDPNWHVAALVDEDDKELAPKRVDSPQYEALMRLSCNNGKKTTCTAGLISSNSRSTSSDVALTAANCLSNMEVNQCVLETQEKGEIKTHQLKDFKVSDKGWALLKIDTKLKKVPFLVTEKTEWKRSSDNSLNRYCSNDSLTVNLLSYEEMPQVQRECKLSKDGEFIQEHDCNHNSMGSMLFSYHQQRMTIIGINTGLGNDRFNRSLNFVNDEEFFEELAWY